MKHFLTFLTFLIFAENTKVYLYEKQYLLDGQWVNPPRTHYKYFDKNTIRIYVRCADRSKFLRPDKKDILLDSGKLLLMGNKYINSYGGGSYRCQSLIDYNRFQQSCEVPMILPFPLARANRLRYVRTGDWVAAACLTNKYPRTHKRRLKCTRSGRLENIDFRCSVLLNDKLHCPYHEMDKLVKPERDDRNAFLLEDKGSIWILCAENPSKRLKMYCSKGVFHHWKVDNFEHEIYISDLKEACEKKKKRKNYGLIIGLSVVFVLSTVVFGSGVFFYFKSRKLEENK